ncbi:juvenile hormone esterase-like [Chelonus insularis]|uniref:juvenile hormone esterase-like n=1 Tax=Chelonus insularis TaxID=460826 RepID=UPI00158F4AE9|nr:juvenile hormone esterase-like [Chelonus insularis]
MYYTSSNGFYFFQSTSIKIHVSKMLQSLFLLILPLISTFFCILSKAEFTEIVETDKGKVRGEILTTVQSYQKYSAFKGIPYATPPIGYGRRFRRPVEAQPWEGVLDALNDPIPCAQIDAQTLRYMGDEDCLYLNVYTPELNFKKPKSRAVMVWIHEGAFMFGYVRTSRYGPDFLIEKDVVLVAMNYRLSIFGFFTFRPTYFDSNNGLRDQALALKWVQKNIHKFGGDPTKVTIFGESAGGSSVEYHRLSPISQGLFRASISMSGSAMHEWAAIGEKLSRQYGEIMVTRMLQIPLLSDQYVYNRMVNEDTWRLIRFTIYIILGARDLIVKPAVESKAVDDPFIPNDSTYIYRSRNCSPIPHILGFTNAEAIAVLNFLGPIPYIFGEDFTDSKMALYSDAIFICDVDKSQRYLNHYCNTTVWYYRNSFDYDRSLHKLDGMNRRPGCGHADDIAHIFWMDGMQQSLDPNSDIAKHRKNMVTMWTNFAKYLRPTIPENKALDVGVDWPPTDENGTHLEIDKVLRVSHTRPISKAVESMIGREEHFD